MNTDRELMQQALETLNHVNVQDRVQIITALRERLAQPAQQEQGDSNCQDADGCPTEMAVLQRFWRGEPIPAEHYPVWFKPAQQQEPVAWMHPDGRIWTFGRGLDKSTFTIPLYTTPPQRKPLTEEEIDNIWGSEKAFPDIYAIARAIELAHGIGEKPDAA